MDNIFRSQDDRDRKKLKQRIFSLLGIVVVLLIGSTLVYSHLEGWSLLDSLYFSTVTMTTIGYGDLTPTHDVSKIFTIFFVLSGVAIMLYTLSTLGMYYMHYFDYHQPAIRENIKNTVKKLYPQEKHEKWVDIYRMKKKP